MTSSIGHLLLLSLLFLSLQTHARESHFFSKASRSEASTIPIAEEPAMVLPPQSRNGYGLYGDIDHSPSTTTTTTNNLPLTSADTEYKDQSNANAIPSTTMAFSNEFSSHEQPNANTIPSTFSHEFNHHGSAYETKAPDYLINKEYGLSDTRLLDNGKYSYDLNSEGYSKEYRPMKENAQGYRSYVESRGGNYVNGGYGNGDNSRRNGYMHKNEMAEYPNNQADYENLEEYVP